MFRMEKSLKKMNPSKSNERCVSEIAPNKSLKAVVIFPRFNGHQNLTQVEVSHAQVQPAQEDLALSE